MMSFEPPFLAQSAAHACDGCPQECFPECLCFSCTTKGSSPEKGASPGHPSLRVLFCNVKHPWVLLALKPSMGLAGSPLLPPFTVKVSIHRKESQTLENNFREILFLIEQIDVLKALLRDMRDGLHNSSWNADIDPTEGWNHTEVIDEVSEPGREAGVCPLSESGQHM